MTEEEFYKLKPGDLVEYNGDRYRFAYSFNVRHGYGFSLAKMFKYESLELSVYQCGEQWFNSIGTSDDRTLGNLKLIKKNSTIDEKISETKSEIEKLQNQLKELESEKNSKKIEQLISEMVPGKFYTLSFKDSSITVKFLLKYYSDFYSCFLYKFIMYSHGETFEVSYKTTDIEDIIPREDLTNDYNKFMEKIKKYNQGEI